jgi:hypothetical protein
MNPRQRIGRNRKLTERGERRDANPGKTLCGSLRQFLLVSPLNLID